MLCLQEPSFHLRISRHCQHGILIRDASNFPGLDAHHFRIAAQRPDENDRLLAALREIK